MHLPILISYPLPAKTSSQPYPPSRPSHPPPDTLKLCTLDPRTPDGWACTSPGLASASARARACLNMSDALDGVCVAPRGMPRNRGHGVTPSCAPELGAARGRRGQGQAGRAGGQRNRPGPSAAGGVQARGSGEFMSSDGFLSVTTSRAASPSLLR